jgi:hypothetical protein
VMEKNLLAGLGLPPATCWAQIHASKHLADDRGFLAMMAGTPALLITLCTHRFRCSAHD